MPTDSPTPPGQPIQPDLGRLPVRLHVLLAQVDMTLAQLTELTKGAILDLERGKTEPVRLTVNGQVVGEGELVDVEGHLGVKVTGWKE